jgi:hypothetical protein
VNIAASGGDGETQKPKVSEAWDSHETVDVSFMALDVLQRWQSNISVEPIRTAVDHGRVVASQDQTHGQSCWKTETKESQTRQ